MPASSTVHLDTALTNVSLAYRNPNLLADVIAPQVPVRRQSDKYFVYDPDGERFRPVNDRRAPGALAAEVDFTLSTDSYFASDHALTSAISDEERDNADTPLSVDIDRVEFLSDKIALNREVSLAATFNAAGSLLSGEDVIEANRWFDTDSDPVGMIASGKRAILQGVQQEANTLVLSLSAYDALRVHPSIKELAGSANSGIPDATDLAKILDVERVLVGRGYYNAAKPGQAPDMLPIWGDNAALVFVPRRPGLKTVSALYTFTWSQAPGSIGGRVVEVWRENGRKADMIRVQHYYDHKVVSPNAAYVWRGVTTPEE